MGCGSAFPDGCDVVIEEGRPMKSGTIIALEKDGRYFLRRHFTTSTKIILDPESTSGEEDMAYPAGRGLPDGHACIGTAVWFQSSGALA